MTLSNNFHTMKTVDQIIEAYQQDGHIVDGLFIQEVQVLGDDEILGIILEASGRSIEILEFGTNLDGQWYKFNGQKDPSFDITKYM